ncbi:hypothetical protein Maes01_02481 [Microbulbifer aestuariivivens]|uniref:Uncharacterized protein n=1 Tax=Microbulbifer aestuariivivens TaxID=1908308 RepID=A0ABP9WUG0_9GAMM
MHRRLIYRSEDRATLRRLFALVVALATLIGALLLGLLILT